MDVNENRSVVMYCFITDVPFDGIYNPTVLNKLVF